MATVATINAAAAGAASGAAHAANRQQANAATQQMDLHAGASARLRRRRESPGLFSSFLTPPRKYEPAIRPP